YIPILINDCGQDQYTEFIERSIETGWKNRDSRGLTNKFLEKRLTATSPVSAYTAAGVPALMLTFPGMKDRK
ncbi:MAG: glycosyl hydrolase, partial [Bacteroidales bacterium]|nr:glycosyl hydrolase [Bacteroidales bacterium]